MCIEDPPCIASSSKYSFMQMNYLTGSKSNLYCSQSILDRIKKTIFPQEGTYKLYLLKYFGTFAVVIDCAVIEFQKHWLINSSNTT